MGLETSLEYTNQWGIKTLREGVRVSTRQTRVFDLVRLDIYGRMNHSSASGFDAGVDRKLPGNVSVFAGYASVDRYFGDLNADAFLHGNRVYFGGSVPITDFYN